ncbi:outer membrane protein assembly factor BamD [Chromobacterium haemolyticum]|uniref:Outer membrane protein assembly factor BamD n=1 Tax=Chromobacterium fluminis TaxID=3044269 RepID=A0ABX0L0V6_9NEIS|nr:outer membrane protein assembly factor BamD [Chromobacterium haemolyticum]NHR05365.1 outer membrane protein assembly factor BamD [Chromobacterium haemolyticum]OQS32628.1 outer membrane protein assembly factor BamD [Chromobacterium haemolyticum]
MKRYVVAAMLVMGLAGCATTETYDETRGWTVEKLYSEAHDELNSGNYTRAVKLYETLEARFPYGRYAQQAQMDLAYTHYKDNEPEQAIASADRFIKLHPTHPNLDYLYYLKGLVFYNDDSGLLAKWAGQDMSERDPRAAREAFTAFRELVTRFPNSIYKEDASKKMERLLDALGGNEMHVARYYMKRGAYLAAANRAQGVVKSYANTKYPEEALGIMMAAYDKLSMPQLRDDAKRVLALNYPNSEYLKAGWSIEDMPWWKLWK